MRYCKQRDKYSCGAIAVLNATKWLGWGFGYKDLPFIKATLGTTKFYGTLRNNFDHVVRIWLGAKRLYTPNINNMEAQLKKGRSLLVNEIFKDGRGHYYFIPELTWEDQYFRIVNFVPHAKIIWVSKKDLSNELKRLNDYVVWSLGRGESPWLLASLD